MSIAHFTLATRDVIATRDFFAETLGWEPIARPGNVEVDAAWLMRVVQFYDALGIDAAAHFHKATDADLTYPIAFLASLPSGSMVRRFEGHGGILNRLTLEFGAEPLPLTGPPEVSLELPKRLRASFNRVLTSVKEGVRTAVQGSALVLPKPPADWFRPRPEHDPTV